MLDRLLAFGESFLVAAERLFLVLANVALAAMLAINILNIFWRGLTEQNLNFVWPWTTLLFVWMTFFGFFVIYRRAKDITVDYFIDLMGPKAIVATRYLSDIIIVGLMLLLLFEAPRTLASQVGDMELIPLQRYWMSVPLFLSAALIGLHFLMDLIKALQGVPEVRKTFDVPEA
jgi:TRAP-type C4-dicarboxylate transport system permease small subunit